MIIKLVASTYILSVLVTQSSILSKPRSWLIGVTPWLKIGNHPHMLECRLCVGFWISLGLTLYFGRLDDMFLVYGVSYFMATQER